MLSEDSFQYATALVQEKEELQCQLCGQATRQADQGETRARDAERKLLEANSRTKVAEEEIAKLQERLQKSEAGARERRERLGEAEGRLADMVEAVREEERRRRQAEERVADTEGRVRVATERQRRAEERMTEAENTRRQAEERQGDFERRVIENEQIVYRRVQQAEQAHREALRRCQLAEGRLTEETRVRIECERMIQQLEVQVREAERVANSHEVGTAEQQDHLFWRVDRREIHLSQQELGRGGWAAVKVAEFRGLQVAAKCLHSVIISEHNRRLFLREMNMAAKLRHPHLVQFIGATLEGEPIILTELMSNSLRDILGTRHLKEQHITTIGRHVALALNYMHQVTPDPVLHRDVSSANVLLNPGPDEGWVAKLSDYGSANFTRLGSTAGPGNPSYAAPEAADPVRQSPKMDVFSFGVLLIEMATGQFPNRNNLQSQLRGVSLPRLSRLIQQCIDDNPTRRPTIAVVLNEL